MMRGKQERGIEGTLWHTLEPWSRLCGVAVPSQSLLPQEMQSLVFM